MAQTDERQQLHFSDFSFDIPSELFCMSERRTAAEARLVVVDGVDKTIRHDVFENLPEYLREDDVVVMNDTGISPSRLRGSAAGETPIEIVFVLDQGHNQWEVMVVSEAGMPPHEGRFTLYGGITGRILGPVNAFNADRISEFDAENWIAKDRYVGYRGLVQLQNSNEELHRALHVHGMYMYPWYTNHDDLPEKILNPSHTARLGAVLVSEPARRISTKMREDMIARGIDVIYISLWMSFGWNTWSMKRPDMALSENKMNYEEYEVTSHAVEQLRRAVRQNKRIISIGTSSARTLESLTFPPTPGRDRTNLFLSPGSRLKYCTGLLTNMHNSMATHIVMAAAFGGADLVVRAYRECIERRYGFGIHGDSMLVLSPNTPSAYNSQPTSLGREVSGWR